MSFHLQICHPNDLFSDEWKTVASSDHQPMLLEELSHPTFEHVRGTLVREIKTDGTVGYQGIYGDTLCLDVGPYSEIAKTLGMVGLDGHHAVSEEFIRRGFLVSYATSNDVYDMIYWLRELLTHKEFVRICYEHCRMSLTKTKSQPLARETMKDALAWLEKDTPFTYSQDLMNRLHDEQSYTARGMCFCIDEPERAWSYAQKSITYVNYHHLRRRPHSYYADRLRKLFPFHMIAERVLASFE